MNSMKCVALILALIVGASSSANAEVQVVAQAAFVDVQAGSTCEGPPAGSDPDQDRLESDELGALDVLLDAARTTTCGDAAVEATAIVVFAGNGISGSAGFEGSLEGVGMMRAQVGVQLDLRVDTTTGYRIQASWSHVQTGDPSQLGGIFASFSTGSPTEESPGIWVWEGSLEPGETYEFMVNGLAFRSAFGLQDGSYVLEDGTNTGTLDFEMSFDDGDIVEGASGSVGQLKTKF